MRRGLLTLACALLVGWVALGQGASAPLPVGATRRFNLGSSIGTMAFSPDGRFLVSGGWSSSTGFGYQEGTVRLWEVATGELAYVLLEDWWPVVGCLTFSADGRMIASGYSDGTTRIWATSTGEQLCILKSAEAGEHSLAFSPDGRTLVVGTANDDANYGARVSTANTVKVWDVASKTLMGTLYGHTSWVMALAFSADARTVASGSFDKTIRLWDTALATSGKTPRSGDSSQDTAAEATGVLLQTLTAHTSEVSSLVFSPDGSLLASGSKDGTIKLWNVGAGTSLRTLSGHKDSVECVAFSPDGKTLASGSRDQTVRLWEVAAGAALCTLIGHTERLLSVAFTPDGESLVSGSGDGTVLAWNVEGVLHPNRLPVPSFVWQVLSSTGTRLVVEPRGGDRISFDASASLDSDGKIADYAWDWESDGTYDVSSASAIAEHAFTSSGTHRVTLRVTDDKGATATVTQTINIGAKQPPQAGFSVAPAKPSILDAVQFTDASTDADGTVTAWTWEFGDGTTSTERSPTHSYAHKGALTVTLTVTDNDGLTGTKTLSLTVVNFPPEASFAFEPQAPVPGQTVRFSASASTDRDGTISSCAWDFDGDGKTDASGAAAAYSFTSAGDRTVTLVVTDSDGATAQQQETITVAAVPPGPPRFAKQWGLVIGVAQYEDAAIPDLRYTEADAQAFYDFLTDPRGGGFVKDNVRLLLNEQATSTAVKGGFSWLIQQAKKDDLVVIYFAGHGGTAPDLSQPPDEEDGVDEYLVTYDAQASDLFSTAVRDDEVGDWLASFRSDHVVLIFDSCFAAGATRSLGQEGTRAGPGNQVFTDMVGDGRLFLAASQETEVSYEDPTLGHGVFTYYLLRGLGALGDPKTLEADADKDGRVTVEELQTYLAREVSKERNQHPLVTGDFTLARVALSGYGEPLVGEVTAIDGDRVSISLGSRQGVQVGDRFEVVHDLLLPDGTTMTEVRAIIEVLYVLGPDRAACRIVEIFYPIEARDSVRVPRGVG